MGIKKFKPYTPSRRFIQTSDFSDLTPGAKPPKSLLIPRPSKGGRNAQGHITIRHRGGGNKHLYRKVDFRCSKDGVPAVVHSIQYDPNRSAALALLKYADGDWRYVLAPKGLKPGMRILSGEDSPILIGNTLALKWIPVGSFVYNIELSPGKGGQLARSAGASAQILAREHPYVLLRLPSGEIRKVLAECRATVGSVGNEEHSNIVLGKAGRKRWLGIRPTVRGTVMNPVDHPHGGGEGKTKGRHPRSPWGWCTKGRKTRKYDKPSNRLIVQKRKRKKL